MKRNNTDPEDIYRKLLHSNILFEDNHLIIVNKLAGQIVQGDKTGDIPLSEIVKQYIKHKYSKPGEVFLGVVHRIDRPVSGAVMFARTSKALTRLNAMVKNRELEKKYWAIVKNLPSPTEGELVSYLYRDQEKNKSFIVSRERKDAQLALLSYKLLSSSDHYYLLEINLKTGRHHQIRSQLASIGCPIKGDLKYGSDRSNPDGSIHLHARQLSFIHPVSKQEVSIIAPVPADALWQYFEGTSNHD